MMTNNIKMMDDMELEKVAGGIIPVNQKLRDCTSGENAASDGSFGEAVSTAYEVVKYVLFG